MNIHQRHYKKEKSGIVVNQIKNKDLLQRLNNHSNVLNTNTPLLFHCYLWRYE